MISFPRRLFKQTINIKPNNNLVDSRWLEEPMFAILFSCNNRYMFMIKGEVIINNIIVSELGAFQQKLHK